MTEQDELLLRQNPVKDFETPRGVLRIVLDTELQLDKNSEPHNVLDLLSTKDPVFRYLQEWGKEKNSLKPRSGLDDHIPDVNLLPTVKPLELRILHCVVVKDNPLFALGVLRYEQVNREGKVTIAEREIFFRPDSASALVLFKDTDTGKQYVVLNRAWKNGVGGPLTGETLAGSMDKEGEDFASNVLREVSEEIGITADQLKSARVQQVFNPLTVSPGGTTEAIAGFSVELSLKHSQIEALKQKISGADEHEFVQNILLEIPSLQSASESVRGFELFNRNWQEILSSTKDLKTYALLQSMYIEKLRQIVTLLHSREGANSSTKT